MACKPQTPAPSNNRAVSVFDSGYHTFPGKIGKNGTATIATNDGNLALCGMNNGRGFVVKVTKQGSVIWRKDHMVYDGTELVSVAGRGDGGFMLCGAGKTDILVIATTASGEKHWLKNYGNGPVAVARGIVRTADDNFIIAGHSSISDSTENTDIFLLKIDANGTVIWRKTLETPQAELCHNLLPVGTDIMVTGSKTETGAQHLYQIKLDAAGNKLWEKTETGYYCSNAYTVANGTNIISCITGAVNGCNAALVIKADASGKMIWKKVLSEPATHIDIASVYAVGGRLLLAGSSRNIAGASNPSDIFLASLDEGGNLQWEKTLGGSKDDAAYFIIDDSGELVISGNTASYGNENKDGNAFILRTDNNGNIVD
jgi:hypothetical protein